MRRLSTHETVRILRVNAPEESSKICKSSERHLGDVQGVRTQTETQRGVQEHRLVEWHVMRGKSGDVMVEATDLL